MASIYFHQYIFMKTFIQHKIIGFFWFWRKHLQYSSKDTRKTIRYDIYITGCYMTPQCTSSGILWHSRKDFFPSLSLPLCHVEGSLFSIFTSGKNNFFYYASITLVSMCLSSQSIKHVFVLKIPQLIRVPFMRLFTETSTFIGNKGMAQNVAIKAYKLETQMKQPTSIEVLPTLKPWRHFLRLQMARVQVIYGTKDNSLDKETNGYKQLFFPTKTIG